MCHPCANTRATCRDLPGADGARPTPNQRHPLRPKRRMPLLVRPLAPHRAAPGRAGHAETRERLPHFVRLQGLEHATARWRDGQEDPCRAEARWLGLRSHPFHQWVAGAIPWRQDREVRDRWLLSKRGKWPAASVEQPQRALQADSREQQGRSPEAAGLRPGRVRGDRTQILTARVRRFPHQQNRRASHLLLRFRAFESRCSS